MTEKKKLYRKKIQLRLNEVHFDEISGISVGFQSISKSSFGGHYVKFKIGFSSGLHELVSLTVNEKDGNAGEFWSDNYYRIFWIDADIEKKSIELEIVELPKPY